MHIPVRITEKKILFMNQLARYVKKRDGIFPFMVTIQLNIENIGGRHGINLNTGTLRLVDWYQFYSWLLKTLSEIVTFG